MSVRSGPRPSRRGGDLGKRAIRTPEYRQWRLAYLKEHPLCVACSGFGLTAPATELDHIRSREEGGRVRSAANVAGLCLDHHRLRSQVQRRNGGFARHDRTSGHGIQWWQVNPVTGSHDLTLLIRAKYRRGGVAW